MAIMFPKFLENENVYDQVVKWWGDLINRIAPLWTFPYYNNPDKDGNPVISARGDNRILRVIQHSEIDTRDEEEDDEGPDIYHFWDKSEGVPELVVCCVLTDETAILVEKTIKAWVDNDIKFGEEIDWISD